MRVYDNATKSFARSTECDGLRTEWNTRDKCDRDEEDAAAD